MRILISIIIIILTVNFSWGAELYQDNLAWGWHKKKKVKQEKIKTQDEQNTQENSQNSQINNPELLQETNTDENETDNLQETENNSENQESNTSEIQEEKSEEDSEKPVRQDTETTVNYTMDSIYKVKHELLKFYLEEYQKDYRNTKVVLKLANIYLDLGQRAEAKAYFMQLYNTYPYDPAIQFEMGKFYYKCKQYNTALEFFKLALSSGYLKNRRLNEYTLKTYEKLGDEENAELYKEILKHLSTENNNQTNNLTTEPKITKVKLYKKQK